jgi:hypothetical protein
VLNHVVYYVDEMAVRGMSNLPCPMLDDGFSLSFFLLNFLLMLSGLGW